MKSIKYISGLIVAMMMASSCNNDDMPQVVGDNDVKVSATISGIQSRANTEGNGGQFSAGDKIVLTNITNNTTATYVTADGSGAFSPVGEAVVTWAPSVKNNFRAYSPETSSYETFTIPSDQSTVEGIRSADWLKAEATNVVRPDDASLALNFNHQLSKVTITINEYTGSMEGADVASFTPTDVTLNSAAKIVGSGAAYELFSIAPYVVVDNSAGHHSFVALIAPHAYKSGDLFMSFTLNGRSYKVMANSDMCSSDFLKAGKNYCFNLKVEGIEEVSIGNVSVVDWEEGDVVNNLGGNLTTPYQECSYTIDPNNPTHAIFQADSFGQFDGYIYNTPPIDMTNITDITIKGLRSYVYGSCYQLHQYNVVIEDAEKITFQRIHYDAVENSNTTFTDATSFVCLTGGGVNSRSVTYQPFTHTYKVIKPLDYVSSAIVDYSYLHDRYPDFVADNSQSEITLYLNASQKKMELEKVMNGYINFDWDNLESPSNLHVYRPTDENFWTSGETEKSNAEFCGITFKKIIKIQ